MTSASTLRMGFAMAGALIVAAPPAWAQFGHALQRGGIVFERNDGQWPELVSHVARVGDLVVRAEASAIGLQRETAEGGHLVRLVFEGGAAPVRAKGEARGLEVRHHLYDWGEWTHVPVFHRLRFSDVVPGVDVALRDGGGWLEYDLHVESPEALGALTIRVEGADGLSLGMDGRLIIETPLGAIQQSLPRAYAGYDGTGRPVECQARLVAPDRFAFGVVDSEHDGALWIDPSLVWGTYIHGTTVVSDMIFAPDGRLLVTGQTASLVLPVTVGAFQTKYGGGSVDRFVCKVEPDGSAILFCTYLGGSGNEGSSVMDLQSDGTIILAGATEGGTGFPTTPGAWDQTLGGIRDIFVTALAPEGDALVFSTFLGGDDGEIAYDVLVDEDDTILVLGRVCGFGFGATYPTTPGAFQSTIPWRGGICDAVISRLSADGSQLLHSTLLGGQWDEQVDQVMVVDDEIVVFGATASDNFPTTPGVMFTEFLIDPPAPSLGMGFISILSADLTTLIRSTYLTTGVNDAAFLPGKRLLAVNGGVGAHLAPFFVVSPDAYDSDFSPIPPSTSESALATLSLDLTGYERTTFLGYSISRRGLVADEYGIVTAGTDTNKPFETTPDGVQPIKPAGACVGWVARFDHELKYMKYGTFFGGPSPGCLGGVEAMLGLPDGEVLIGGGAWSVPTTPGTIDPDPDGTFDAFLAQIRTAPPWDVLGGDIAGTDGFPHLIGHGWPEEGDLVGLSVRDGLPFGLAAWVLGFAELSAPFKGGVLVPSPDFIVPGLSLDSRGELTFTGTWPRDIPAGIATWHQIWIADPAAPAGFSATNGLTTISR